MKINYLIAIGMFVCVMDGKALEEERKPSHQLAFKTQYLNIKDGYNYGLTHRGLNLAGAYTLSLDLGKNRFTYDNEIALGINYNRGMGMAWTFKPFDFYYGSSLKKDPETRLFLGPYLSGFYQWQLYPELQSGHMLWFSSYEAGLKFQASHPVNRKRLGVTLAGAFATLNSRPQHSPESYFYSLTFSDFVKNVHTDMTFGSLGSYQHYQLQIDLSGMGKGFSIGYLFELISYTDNPTYQYLIHSINLVWQLGNKNKE